MKNKGDGVDLEAIYISWACPLCKEPVHQDISDVSFGMDIDLQLKVDGTIDIWFESKCLFCQANFTKMLESGEM